MWKRLIFACTVVRATKPLLNDEDGDIGCCCFCLRNACLFIPLLRCMQMCVPPLNPVDDAVDIGQSEFFFEDTRRNFLHALSNLTEIEEKQMNMTFDETGTLINSNVVHPLSLALEHYEFLRAQSFGAVTEDFESKVEIKKIYEIFDLLREWTLPESRTEEHLPRIISQAKFVLSEASDSIAELEGSTCIGRVMMSCRRRRRN